MRGWRRKTLPQRVNLPSSGQSCSGFRNSARDLQGKARVEKQILLDSEVGVGPKQSWISICRRKVGRGAEKKKDGGDKGKPLWF